MDPTVEFWIAMGQGADRWVPACGGTEVPFRCRGGKMLLYVYNPSIGKHAYLDVESDLILDDEVAAALIAR